MRLLRRVVFVLCLAVGCTASVEGVATGADAARSDAAISDGAAREAAARDLEKLEEAPADIAPAGCRRWVLVDVPRRMPCPPLSDGGASLWCLWDCTDPPGQFGRSCRPSCVPEIADMR